jgi:lytic murein transglycosylase
MPAKILTRRAFALGFATSLASPAAAKPPAKKEIIKPRPSPQDLAFAKFVRALWPDAKDAGVSQKTFDAAFHGVAYDPRIVAHTEGQAEFVAPIWQYLAGALTAKRIEDGKTKYAEQKSWIDKAEKDFGVSAATIMGVWGIETGYGAFQGSDYVIRALASLALSQYQPEYFRSELIAALKILEDGDIAPKNMLGSWAGAMGQTQFMPSSYLKYAVDFDEKGRRDIWNDPADAIGSTANYLKEHGWNRDEPWGFEVTLPDGFGLKAEDFVKAAAFWWWAWRGVKRADGGPMPSSGDGQLMMLAGLKAPIFLITANFKTIKTYNNSTSYALAVSLLGDAILDGAGLHADWPVKDRQLSKTEIEELQTRLKKMGYYDDDVDGRVGENLRAAVARYQEKIGETPDGYATPAVLKRVVEAP